ncbi:protein YceI [Roseibium sp. TrichSKD4]|uniref:YceI family protein n=1 Tax=Roseibium sp. TrichSKD4 TaxID=744980 RepID=UPI0001E5621F|nr:YceI family protein [Roseibium sp. TrichSKD4]EFO33766.1 protein YceI [Roseibium sp. TrichSKD4]
MRILASLVAFGLVASSLTLEARAEPHRYELDPEHTTVAFTVKHIGFADTLGLFTNVQGEFVYDMETQELSDLNVTVETPSVGTFNAARDNHVRNKDFLDAEKHPVMIFTADTGTPTSETEGTVSGMLQLRGNSVPLTLDVTLNRAAEYPFGHKRFVLGISARGTLKRSDFGMTYAVDNGLVGDDVNIIIETEAMRMK